MSQVSALLVMLAVAAPASAAEGGESRTSAKVCVQAIEAKPGKNRTDKNVDAGLAEKLRVTFKLMGMSKPDLTSLGKKSKSLSAEDTVSLGTSPYTVEVTCEEVGEEDVKVSVELFKEEKNPETGKLEKKSKNRSSGTLNAEGDPHVVTVMQSSDRKKVFVITQEKAEK